jgi:hypothetical protein
VLELGQVAFAQEAISFLQRAASGQAQLLRQRPLPGGKLRSLRPRACGE